MTIIDDWQPLANQLNAAFNWNGSKINWEKVKNHQSIETGLDFSKRIQRIIKLISLQEVSNIIHHSKQIYYMNDSSLDFAISCFTEDIDAFLVFTIERIPQYHCYFDRDIHWFINIGKCNHGHFFSIDEMSKCLASPDWEYVTLEEANKLSPFLYKNHPILFESWNEIAREAKDYYKQYIEDSIQIDGIYDRLLKDCVGWDGQWPAGTLIIY